METRVERVESHDRELSTAELFRRALDEAKILARAELLYAKQELRGDLAKAKTAGVFLGIGLTLGICGLSALFIALAALLPLDLAPSAAIVGGALLIIAVVCAFLGIKRIPRKVLSQTQLRLKADVTFAKETFA